MFVEIKSKHNALPLEEEVRETGNDKLTNIILVNQRNIKEVIKEFLDSWKVKKRLREIITDISMTSHFK